VGVGVGNSWGGHLGWSGCVGFSLSLSLSLILCLFFQSVLLWHQRAQVFFSFLLVSLVGATGYYYCYFSELDM